MKTRIRDAAAVVAAMLVAFVARGARFDAGRLLYETDARAKVLRVEDNVAALERGDAPAFAVGNIVRWLELKGVDCGGWRRRYAVKDVPVGPPLASREGGSLGYMLDISRDKVPTMEMLRNVVSLLASLGYNEFQLYTEHAFAYAGHEAAWRGASPMTPEEVRDLDAFCAARGVRLMPNQSSFGHLEKWLRRAEYRDLAETPGGYTVDWIPGLKDRPPCALCPTDERTYAFLDGLYAQLLPNFRHASCVNVGCDEVWDIFDASGRSAAKVREKGVARVYMDHLKRIHALLRARGFRMAFWADMVLYAPELLDEVPKDSVALLWNYGSERDFPGITAENEGRMQALRMRGLDVVVCPSTRVYGTWFGRTGPMMGNVSLMDGIARRYGAKGLLLTTWGDGGHRAPFVAEVPAIVYAAMLARGESPDEAGLAAEIDRALGCRVGAALLEIGRIDARDADAPRRVRRAAASADLAGAQGWVARGFRTFLLAADFIEGDRSGDCGERYRRLWLADSREGGLAESMDEIGIGKPGRKGDGR